MANLTIILNKPKTASQEAVEHQLPVGAAGSKIVTKDKQYELTLTVEKLDFKKKVYSPCELNFQINITEIVDKSDKKQEKTVALDFSHCSKIADTMTDFFVKLRCDNPSSSVYACENYYVYSVNPEFSTEGGKPTITLNVAAYSADHRLTLHKTNRAFTAKKFFSEVVVNDLGSSGALAAFNVEVNKDKCLQFIKSYKKIVTLDNTSIKEIKYEERSEIIHPYMVQYDETYYNFLARTANRCGEFMYFEDGKLNFGLDKPYYEQPQVINYDNSDDIKDRRSTITGVSLTRLSTPNQPELKAYYPSTMVFNDQKKAELTYSDTNFVEDAKVGNDEFLTTMKKSDWVPKVTFYAPEGAGGEIVPILSDILCNQSIIEMVGDIAVKEGLKYANCAIKEKTYNTNWNKKIWDKYAKDDRMIKKDKESYMFTSDTTKWDSNLQNSVFKGSNFKNEMNLIFYHTLLNLEREVAKEAITISTGSDFDDEVKIGKIIQFNGKRYVVVGVYGVYNTSKDKARPVEKYSFTAVPVKEIKNLDLTLYNYQEIQNDKTSKREPKVSEKINAVTAIIPPLYEHGHICYSSMQRAIVVNAGDPQSYGRVQIKYPWQQKEDKDDDPSPFIRVAKDCAGDGFGINFKTEKDTEVLVDYEGGNVERPFVVGMLHSFVEKPQTATRSIRSYNGHKIVFDDPSDSLKMFENLAGGAASLLLQALPMSGIDLNFKKIRQLAGGIELSDKYGFYKIAMSTDKRQIDIASPFGKVNINAFTGINISAPNGDIKICGKNVEIEATNNLNICSGSQIDKKLISSGKSFLDDLTEKGASLLASLVNQMLPDIKLLRCIVEAFVKPCNGTLKLKSYRYLMLESGINGIARPPKTAYKDGHYFAKGNDKTLSFTENFDITATIGNLDRLERELARNLFSAYNDAVAAKQAFDTVINENHVFGIKGNDQQHQANITNIKTALIADNDNVDVPEGYLNIPPQEEDVYDDPAILWSVDEIRAQYITSRNTIQIFRRHKNNKNINTGADLGANVQQSNPIISNNTKLWAFITQELGNDWQEDFSQAITNITQDSIIARINVGEDIKLVRLRNFLNALNIHLVKELDFAGNTPEDLIASIDFKKDGLFDKLVKNIVQGIDVNPDRDWWQEFMDNIHFKGNPWNNDSHTHGQILFSDSNVGGGVTYPLKNVIDGNYKIDDDETVLTLPRLKAHLYRYIKND